MNHKQNVQVKRYNDSGHAVRLLSRFLAMLAQFTCRLKRLINVLSADMTRCQGFSSLESRLLPDCLGSLNMQYI